MAAGRVDGNAFAFCARYVKRNTACLGGYMKGQGGVGKQGGVKRQVGPLPSKCGT